MIRTHRRSLYRSICYLAAFAVWTAALHFVDVMPIGPMGSSVGFSSLNSFIHDLTGVHMLLYTLTDWLGLVPLAFMLCFALLGLMQWIKRRQLRRVDHSLLVLGGFYLVVIAAYMFFEIYVVNYRPVLIGGNPEASYPSSTTMLVMCVMPTAIMELRARIKNHRLRRLFVALIALFAAFMVIARLISGVHWFSDIVGGALLSTGLVRLYAAMLHPSNNR